MREGGKREEEKNKYTNIIQHRQVVLKKRTSPASLLSAQNQVLVVAQKDVDLSLTLGVICHLTVDGRLIVPSFLHQAWLYHAELRCSKGCTSLLRVTLTRGPSLQTTLPYSLKRSACVDVPNSPQSPSKG